MKPIKRMTFLRLGSVVAALLTLAVLPACEDTSVNTSDLDSYFANNPYVSDPRTGPGSDVSINPTAASISVVGQEVVFTASGGNTPYSWHVANNDNGSIIGRGSQGDYKATRLGNNNVIVYDIDGHAAIATISAGGASIMISPSTATIPTSAGNQVQFTVVGGQPPYTWSVSFPDLATISQDGLYTSKLAGGGSINVVTVVDQAGNTATATVTHGTPLTISPSTAVISAGNSVTFTANGGRGSGNYHWQVANTSLVDPPSSGNGDTFVYKAAVVSSNMVNSLTLTDGSGASATATITHN